MSSNMTDKVNAYATESPVMDVAVEAKRLQVAGKLAGQEWGGLAAAGISGFLRAEEYQGDMWARAGLEWRKRRRYSRKGK